MLCPILPISEAGLNSAKVRLGIPIDSDIPIYSGDFVKSIQEALRMTVDGRYNKLTMTELKNFAINRDLYDSYLGFIAGGKLPGESIALTTCALYQALGIPCSGLQVMNFTPGKENIEQAVANKELNLSCAEGAVGKAEGLFPVGIAVLGMLGLSFLRGKAR